MHCVGVQCVLSFRLKASQGLYKNILISKGCSY
jgi:hypothetical protein